MELPAGLSISAFIFIAIGLWHLICSFSSFTRSPSAFIARPCHPFPRLPGSLKHLELYLLIVSIPLGIGYELVMATNFDPLVQGSTPVFRMATLLHVGMLLMFGLFAVTSLIHETTDLLPLPRETFFLFAATAFASEWMVLSFEAQITGGLEGECDRLLASIAAICSVVCALLAWQPRILLADMVLNMAILFQGMWRLQVFFSLHVDGFIPQGCHRLLDVSGSVEGSTRCDLEDSNLRAVALMDFLFICHALFVVIVAVVIYGFVAKKQNYTRYISYDALSPTSHIEHLQMKPLPYSDL